MDTKFDDFYETEKTVLAQSFPKMEERIILWLEEMNILMADPMQKCDEFYEDKRRKVESLRSLRSLQSISLPSTTSIEDNLTSLQSIADLNSIKSQKRSSLETNSTQGNFLKGDTAWRLKNRRKTAAPPKENAGAIESFAFKEEMLQN